MNSHCFSARKLILPSADPYFLLSSRIYPKLFLWSDPIQVTLLHTLKSSEGKKVLTTITVFSS